MVIKANLPVGGLHQVPVPMGSRLVYLSSQNAASEVHLWYEAEWAADGADEHETTVRNLRAFATGEPIADEGLRFIGTALSPDHGVALHVYEQQDPVRRAPYL